MVNCCCIVGCSNKSNRNKDVSFYCIPAILVNQGEHAAKLSKERREKWLSNIISKAKGPGWEPTKSSRVCSAHFITGKPSYLHTIDNPDWAPTQKMGYTGGHLGSPAGSPAGSQRFARSKQRKRKADDMAAAATLLGLEVPTHQSDCDESSADDIITQETEIQTDISSADISLLEATISQLQQDNMNLRSELQMAQNRIKSSGLQEDDFQDNDVKLKFYTGLPSWATFLSLFTLLSSAMPSCRKLTKFDQVMMFLMKMRINVLDEDLGYRFGVNQSTVSRNFHRMLDIFFVRISSLTLMAEVKVPPFKRGKKQLEKVEVDWSRELSGEHEKVIGMVKQKYTILQNRIPIDLMKDGSSPEATVNKIVRVACALVNLCPGEIPLD